MANADSIALLVDNSLLMVDHHGEETLEERRKNAKPNLSRQKMNADFEKVALLRAMWKKEKQREFQPLIEGLVSIEVLVVQDVH